MGVAVLDFSSSGFQGMGLLSALKSQGGWRQQRVPWMRLECAGQAVTCCFRASRFRTRGRLEGTEPRREWRCPSSCLIRNRMSPQGDQGGPPRGRSRCKAFAWSPGGWCVGLLGPRSPNTSGGNRSAAWRCDPNWPARNFALCLTGESFPCRSPSLGWDIPERKGRVAWRLAGADLAWGSS